MNTATDAIAMPKPAPVKPTWVCLILAWVLFLLPVPGVGLFIGWPLNLVAFILAVVVMARGYTSRGLIPLIASLIVSPVIYFIGLGILGAAAVGSSAYQHRADQAVTRAIDEVPANDAISLSAQDLYLAYDRNEVAADSRYKGKALMVSGTVERIDSDLTDDALVMLEAGDFETVHVKGLAKAAAAGLSKGQQIRVLCRGGGEVIGSPFLEDCSLR